MTAILAALFLFAIALMAALGFGFLLARCERRGKSGLRCLPGKPNRRTGQGQGGAIGPGEGSGQRVAGDRSSPTTTRAGAFYIAPKIIPPIATRRLQPDSLYARLLRRAIDGPKDDK